MKFRNASVTFVLLLAASSCTPHKPYRALSSETKSNQAYVQNLKDRPSTPIKNSSPQATDCLEKHKDEGYWLGHVEYTDYGSFWDPRQISTIERAINTSGEHGPGKLFDNGVSLIVFVHGWQNNSKENNGNLTEFRRLLAAEAANEKARPANVRRGVLGMYLSWRGESTPIPGIKHLTTYWARKRVAHRVGQGSMVETLARIKNLHKDMAARSNKSAREVFQNSRLVLIGHSFGGAALYSAVGPHLESKFLEPYWDARRNAKRSGHDTRMDLVSGYGDLVILINPAFEALPYRSLHYAVRSNQNVNYDKKQPVLLVVLSGEEDIANKSFLPIGQYLGNRQQVFTTKPELKSEWLQMVRSLGHYKPYQTHELDLASSNSPDLVLKENKKYADVQVKGLDEDGDEIILKAPKGLEQGLKSGTAGYESSSPGKVAVAEGTPFYPFMVVSADPKIIAGHNEFWPKEGNRRCYDFLSWLITQQGQQIGLGKSETTEAKKFVNEVNSMPRALE